MDFLLPLESGLMSKFYVSMCFLLLVAWKKLRLFGDALHDLIKLFMTLPNIISHHNSGEVQHEFDGY
jgi:hypothetical protein